MLTKGSDKNMNCESNKNVLSAAAINLKANQAPIRLMNKTACHTQTEAENVCNCLHQSSRTFVPTPPTLMHVYNHIKKGHITHIHSCNHDGFQSKGSLVAQTDIAYKKLY